MLNKIIKDYSYPEKPEVRVRVGKFAGIIGMILNFVLFGVKLLVGLLFGSISIVADSLNNLSDTGTNALTVFSYNVAGKPADKDHPYGHARAEYLASLFTSIIVVFLGIELLSSSIEKIISGPTLAKYSLSSIIIISATILVKIAMALFFRKLGKHINSQVLKASFVDSISDVITTIAVVIAMIITPFTGAYTDSVLGILIAIYIIIAGVKLVISASNLLIGTAPDKNFIENIVSKVRNYNDILGVHDVVVHSYGVGKVFISLHAEVDADKDVVIIHDVIDKIELDFAEKGINLVIHMDPIKLNNPEDNMLKEKCNEIIKKIAFSFNTPISIHDFRVVRGFLTQTKILFDVSIPNEMPLSDKELSSLIINKIKLLDENYSVLLVVDRDYFSSRFSE